MPNAHRIIFPILLLASGLTVAISERRSTAQGQDAGQARTGVASPGIGQSYLTHLSTDKPIYRAGESLYLRGVLLHARDHRPMQQGACLGSVEIRGPKGDRLASSMVQVQGSLLGFKWTVPEGIAGGEYRIRVSYPGYGYAPAERRFQIRSFRAPRLKSQILFVRDGYGPGDRVAANLSVERAEGGLPAGAQVTIIARVDGQEIYRGRSMVDPTGHCRAAFGLPERIREGDGTLAFVIADGGIQETATKTIPILLQTLDLQLYPEGGDLVAGLPTRIYFQARTPAKKPADVAGVVVDQNGKVVSRFRSAHEGRGRFHFRPVAGASYELELRQPAGISRRWKLPEIKEQGVVLRSFADRYGPGDTLRLSIGSTEAGRFRVALRKRGEELAARWVRVRAGRMELIRFMPIEQADGVLIATVEDERGRPLAERLVFAAPAKELRVQIALDRERYVPGDQVELTLRTTDGSGAPVGAIVGLEATDDSVLELIEKREQAPRLPAMVFLEQEVQELGDAHVYLDPKNPQAPLALDLLLGTQGWRRFAFRNVEDFLAKGGDRARQVVALFIAPRPRSTALRRRGMRPLEKKKMNGLDPIDGHKAPAEEAEAPAIAVDREGDKVARKQEEVAKLAAEVQAKPQAGQAFRLEQRFADRKDADELMMGRGLAQIVAYVREYAHKARLPRRPNERSDFTETVYWNTGVRTDPVTGEARIRFDLSDSVTSFRVHADLFDAEGRVGSGDAMIESRRPFYVEPKLPLEVTAGDRILLPVGTVNNTNGSLSAVVFDLKAGKLVEFESPEVLYLAAGARGRKLVPIRVGQGSAVLELLVKAKAGALSDEVKRKLVIKPRGFPVELGWAGQIEEGGKITRSFRLPDRMSPGSLRVSAAVYPTPLAQLTQALKRLLREPYGCFEQTSSTTYPLVMAQQYFQSHAGVDPELIARSNDLLAKGYKRLVGFECKNRGYEWFGQDPGHEALSAYGLLEFSDMARVRAVDGDMIARTREWILKGRDGKGGFSRKRRALHTWITDPDCSNAYILWSLFESAVASQADLTVLGDKCAKEISALKQAAAKSSNSYVHALAANVLFLAGEGESAEQLLSRLAKAQNKEGAVAGGTTTITASGGEALAIETTALALLAWLRGEDHGSEIENAIRWIVAKCKGGRFGSTQSTVLALRAIVAYDQANSKPKAPGQLKLFVNGKACGKPLAFDQKTQGALELPDFVHLLVDGNNQVEIRMTGGARMPYSISVDYHADTPASSPDCALDLRVDLSDARVAEGEVTEAKVEIRNKRNEAVPTPIAIIGLPGGLEPRHDQLKELVRSGRIAAYEVRGREVVLYWRLLEAEQVVELPLSLVAEVPGEYTAPASRAYLYYTDEHKVWDEPVTVEIAAK